MKLDPIKNPHSKVGQVLKKTKAEEKDDLIEKTKKSAIDKYGVTKHTFKMHSVIYPICNRKNL